MSGGGDDSGGYVAPSGASPCESVRLVRNIESPIAGVIDTLRIGDRLDVVLREGTPALVVAVTQSGDDAGGILPTGQLIECLRQGFTFQAEVKGRNGGAVNVEVRASR